MKLTHLIDMVDDTFECAFLMWNTDSEVGLNLRRRNRTLEQVSQRTSEWLEYEVYKI